MQTRIFQKPGICASGARLGHGPSRDPSVSCAASSPFKGALVGTNSPKLSCSVGLYRPHPPLRRSPFSKEKVMGFRPGEYVQRTVLFGRFSGG